MLANVGQCWPSTAAVRTLLNSCVLTSDAMKLSIASALWTGHEIRSAGNAPYYRQFTSTAPTRLSSTVVSYAARCDVAVTVWGQSRRRSWVWRRGSASRSSGQTVPRMVVARCYHEPPAPATDRCRRRRRTCSAGQRAGCPAGRAAKPRTRRPRPPRAPSPPTSSDPPSPCR